MKKYLILLLLISSLSYSKPRPEIARALQSSVQIIIPEISMGSGVVYKHNGLATYILSNDHVCQSTRGLTLTNSLDKNKPLNSVQLKVKGVDGKSYLGQVIKAGDPKVDLCIIMVKEVIYKAARFGSGLEVGDSIFLVSGPGGVFPMISSGYAGRTYPDKIMKDVRATTVSANHGSSGGGVFNDSGELVGIIFSIITDSDNGSPIASFMVELKDIQEFLP